MKATLYGLVLLVVALAACSDEEPTPAVPLVSIEWRGGLCPYGGCSTTLNVGSDGAYRFSEGDGTESTGFTDAALSSELSDAIARADFDAVRVRGFTETCPTAYDGQEITYTFHGPAGDETMSTCEYVLEWTQPPFPQLLAILELLER